MASLVSSIAEEIGIRGYFQSTLEAKTTAMLAVIIPTLAIAPGHGLTQGFVWPILLFYFLADTTFGMMVYFTNSILPGILVHAVGLLIFFTLIWPFDATRKTILQAGADAWFWLHIAQIIVFALISLSAFIRLAKQRPVNFS